MDFTKSFLLSTLFCVTIFVFSARNKGIEKEAFADFFDAGMSYKPLKQMYIQEVFPNAHKVFEQKITDELQEKTYNLLPDRMIVV